MALKKTRIVFELFRYVYVYVVFSDIEFLYTLGIVFNPLRPRRKKVSESAEFFTDR